MLHLALLNIDWSFAISTKVLGVISYMTFREPENAPFNLVQEVLLGCQCLHLSSSHQIQMTLNCIKKGAPQNAAVLAGILLLLCLFLQRWMTTMLIKWDKEVEQRNSVDPASNRNGVRWWHDCQQPFMTQQVWKGKRTLALLLVRQSVAIALHYDKNKNFEI